MSICGGSVYAKHKHSLGNPHHTGESNQNNYMSRRMKDQHIITIKKPSELVEWCFVKRITYDMCKTPKGIA